MRAAIKVVRFIVFSNIYISLCVCAFNAKTALMVFGNNGNINMNLLVFFATFFLYGFHNRYGGRSLSASGPHEEQNYFWAVHHRRFRLISLVASFVLALSQLYYLPPRAWLIIAPVAVTAFGYTLPIIKTRRGWLRLRDILWLKALWIAFSYAWLTTFLPVTYTLPLRQLFRADVMFIWLRNFLFVFAITLPFDIRDMESDRMKGLRSVPVLLGVRGSIYLSLALLAAFLFVSVVQFRYFALPAAALAALSLSAITTMAVIPLSKPSRPSLFFPLVFETTMILQWLFLLVGGRL